MSTLWLKVPVNWPIVVGGVIAEAGSDQDSLDLALSDVVLCDVAQAQRLGATSAHQPY